MADDTDQICLRFDSLPGALANSSRRAGFDIHPGDLSATMGLPAMACGAPGCPCLACWPGFARDAFLPEAARLFGITVRELHPPRAAQGLERASEFRQHFDASYRPLIKRALENGQYVLAWSAPTPTNPRSGLWWSIENVVDEGLGFSGTLSGGEGADPIGPVVFDEPFTQVYVVEAVGGTSPGPGDLLKTALRHQCELLADEVGGRFDVTTGPGAYDLWRDRLVADSTCPWCKRSMLEDHRRLARSVAEAHRSGVNFFERHRAVAAQNDRVLIETVVRGMGEVIAALTDSIQCNSAEGVHTHLARARAATLTMQSALLSTIDRSS